MILEIQTDAKPFLTKREDTKKYDKPKAAYMWLLVYHISGFVSYLLQSPCQRVKPNLFGLTTSTTGVRNKFIYSKGYPIDCAR